MSILVVRAFVRMRQALALGQKLLAKLSELERRLQGHDAEIQELFDTLRELSSPPPPNRRRIGFETPSISASGQHKLPRLQSIR
jgi:hypothetical protein